jgi:hypothetical protein
VSGFRFRELSRHASAIFIGLVLASAMNSAFGVEMKPEAIQLAEPPKKGLSNEMATPAGVRLRVLLDRARFSPGEIDGKFRENAKKALRAYEEAQKLPISDDVKFEGSRRFGRDRLWYGGDSVGQPACRRLAADHLDAWHDRPCTSVRAIQRYFGWT